MVVTPTTPTKKRTWWSESIGDYRERIRVYESPESGIIYYDISSRGISGRSLRHRDRKRAVRWAKEQHAKMVMGEDTTPAPSARLKSVFAAYRERRTPEKGDAQQHADQQRMALWTQVLGAEKDLSKLTEDEWQDFTKARITGAIDSRGTAVPPDQRTPVRPGTALADLCFLRAVLGWACRRKLMRVDPSAAFELPQDKNPRQAVASEDRYEAIRAVSDSVMMEVGRGREAHKDRSYLSELLDIVNGTGRRIGAVCQLRYEDLRLEKTATRPHGAIRWPASSDKEGKEWSAPINAEVRAALDRIRRERPSFTGSGFLFPGPRLPEKAVCKDLASSWLARAEQLAKLPKLSGTLWHAFRRKWATERKHLPLADVAAAGGWAKGSTALAKCYMQVDDATLLLVVTEPRKLRERKA